MSCTCCLDTLLEPVKYRSEEIGDDTGNTGDTGNKREWKDCLYCQPCIQDMLDRQFLSYVEEIKNETCQVALNRLITLGPPTRFRDPNMNDNREVSEFMCEGKPFSSELKNVYPEPELTEYKTFLSQLLDEKAGKTENTNKIFTDDVLREDDPEEVYRRRNDEEKTSISWGQRKLLLILISFLTQHCSEVENPIIVYAGAAPGVNIGLVADLFPKITWHLYDPATFKVKTDTKRKIIVYNKIFTDENALYWSKKKVIFISDIRTADYTKTENLTQNEEQIFGDMEMQKRWVEIIKPVKTQLKFRLNYTGDGRPDEMEYLDGVLYKQPWAPQTSSETRLVLTSPDLKYKNYSCQKYEYQMFYHNVILREKEKYENSFADEELGEDWDSACEVYIWQKYLATVKTQKTVTDMSQQATTLLTQNRKYKDTLSSLRANPQSIKNRNFKKR